MTTTLADRDRAAFAAWVRQEIKNWEAEEEHLRQEYNAAVRRGDSWAYRQDVATELHAALDELRDLRVTQSIIVRSLLDGWPNSQCLAKCVNSFYGK